MWPCSRSRSASLTARRTLESCSSVISVCRVLCPLCDVSDSCVVDISYLGNSPRLHCDLQESAGSKQGLDPLPRACSSSQVHVSSPALPSSHVPCPPQMLPPDEGHSPLQPSLHLPSRHSPQTSISSKNGTQVHSPVPGMPSSHTPCSPLTRPSNVGHDD